MITGKSIYTYIAIAAVVVAFVIAFGAVFAIPAFAQTVDDDNGILDDNWTTTYEDATTTPGLPETGAGGNTFVNLAIIAAVAAMIIAGSVVLYRMAR
ncbi:MAG: hypothetical protein Q7S15_00960 [bacterium]|nr:hypothetical protein [bacterium]